jgi:hypothetical protein
MLARLEPGCRDCLAKLSASPFGKGRFNKDGFTLITGNAN